MNTLDNIKYAKWNPFVFGSRAAACKRFKKWSTFGQLSIVVLIAVFTLLSLWFATQWGKDTLGNLGVDLRKYEGFTDPTIVVNDENKFVNNLISQADFQRISGLALHSWASSSLLTTGGLNALLIFSFIGLFSLIPFLAIKKGTLISTSLAFFLLASLGIILTFFILGLLDQQKVVSIFKKQNFKSLDDARTILRLIDPNIQFIPAFF